MIKIYKRLKGLLVIVVSLSLSAAGAYADTGRTEGRTASENTADTGTILSATNTQQKVVEITGKVIDENGLPLVGVAVYLKDGSMGVVTGLDGRYQISVPAGSVLVFSFMGFITQEINAGVSGTFNVTLQEDAMNLEELVVIGYGSARKKDLTGGLSVVGKEKLEMVSTNNLMDRLVGQVAGLNITTGDQRPGAEQTLLVRGVNSLLPNATKPFVVLDGIPYTGNLGDIDPNIVENMTVLKDASALAIYGARAAAGVILIQTKRGREGKPTVTYKGQVGFSEVQQRIQVMGPNEYIKFKQDMNRLNSKGYTGDQLDPIYGDILSQNEREMYMAGITHNWQDYVFQTGFTMDHQVSITGGTENTKYLAAVAYLDNTGVVYNAMLKRFNVTANIDQNLNKWLTVGVGTQFIQRESGGMLPNLEHAIKQSPYGKYKDDAGYYILEPQEYSNIPNPMKDVNGIQDYTTRNFILNTYADINLPLEGLSFRTNFGYNYRSTFDGKYYGRDTNEGKESPGQIGGSASIDNSHYQGYTWENILRYVNEWGDHRLDATGLFSVEENKSVSSSMSGEGFVNDDSRWYAISTAERNIKISSGESKITRLSTMFRFNYAYKGKYMATITGRRDGASVFAKNNKWGFFPSAALAWNIAEEGFVRNSIDWMDMLKLRVSYGVNGNEAASAYQSLDRLYSDVKYIWGDGGNAVTTTYFPNNGAGNPNLKWETTYTANIGIDFMFLRGRLGGTIDMYRANTKDLIMTRAVPPMNGFDRIMYNIGKVRNTGIELTLNTVNIEKHDFRWSTDVSFSLNRDKIISLTDGKVDDVPNKWFIGKPVRVYYDYNVVGIWQQWDEFFTTDADGNQIRIQTGAQPGDAKFEDVDGNGIIETDKDKKIIGSTMPDFRMSMGNRFSYKNVYMSFLLNGVFGVWREDNIANSASYTFGQTNYIRGADYWTPEKPYSKYVSPGYESRYTHSFYKKVTYVEIKNITVGYRFASRLANKIGLSAIDVNVGVNNPHTFSNVRQVLNYDTSWFASYPTARSYVLGVNITF